MDLDESSLRILRLKVDSTTGVVYRGKEWPKKTVPLEAEGRVAVLSQDDRLQVLDPASGSLADLECLTGEPVSDACRLPAAASGESDGERRPPLALLVVVTASGRALKVDPLRDAVVGAVDGDLRVEQSEPGMSPVRGKGKSVDATFRLCASGPEHLILIDRSGAAWSWGRGPQTGRIRLGVEEEDAGSGQIALTRIDFFQGLKITSVSSGDRFNVVLAEPTSPKSPSVASPKKYDAAPSGRDAKRVSCPLGLPLDSGKDQGEDVELRKSKVSEECEGEDGGAALRPVAAGTRAERLALSGLYLNSSDALKYLTDQLSWVGLRKGDEGGDGDKEDSDADASPNMKHKTVELPRDEQNQNSEPADTAVMAASTTLLRATSNAIGGGMKLVGQTVSRLSSSFSQDKDDDGSADADAAATTTTITGDDDIALSPPAAYAEFPLVERSTAPIVSRSAPVSNRNTLHRRSQSVGLFLDRLAVAPSPRGVSNGVGGGPVTPNATRNKSDRRRRQRNQRTEVWSWGAGDKGQAGQGDLLDRLQPSMVSALSADGSAVQGFSCGSDHSLALTLTGSVFAWGDNSSGQLASSPPGGQKIYSTPTEVPLPTGETARDIAAFENRSLILTDSGKIYCFGGGSRKLQELDLGAAPADASDDEEDGSPQSIAFAGADVIALAVKSTDLPVSNFKSVEKLFLKKLCAIFYQIINPMYGYHGRERSPEPGARGGEHGEVCADLHRRLATLIDLVSSSVTSSWNLSSLGECDRLSLVRNIAAFEAAFVAYGRAVCDGLVSDCFVLDNADFVRHAAGICDVLRHSCHLDPSAMGQDILSPLLINPLLQLEQYLSCLKVMSQAGRRQGSNVQVLRACDVLESTATFLKAAQKVVEREQKTTEDTKRFWDITGPKFASLKNYRRRVLLNSRDSPVNVSNAGSFSKHWIVLMSDVLAHAGYSSVTTHPLKAIWIEGHSQQTPGNDEISLVMPEETLVLSAPDSEAKNVWFQALQKSIIEALRDPKQCSVSSSGQKDTRKNSYSTPPITRKTEYTFRRIPELKNATYNGTWMHGKMHGHGKIVWPSGKCYEGQMRQNQKHGQGRLTSEDGTVYEGQWVADRFEGHGVILQKNGDRYEGWLKDGRPHGQGVFKQGRLGPGGHNASVYLGEWVNGAKSGYGVADDIVSAEKYMGMWSNDLKSGRGCVVTLDGVYYEGNFSHGKMTGRGLMLFEDETSYEGTFADAGVFSGHGTLSYNNGDRMEGSFYGNYTEGMKFSGTIYKSGAAAKALNLSALNKEKIGTFCVPATQKWLSIYSHYHELLCLPDDYANPFCVPTAAKAGIVWDRLAILINQAKNAKSANNSSGSDILDGLEMIPDYYCTELTAPYHDEVESYLSKAFSSRLHPLENLLSEVTACFNATYGGVRIHPRLLTHAVQELESAVARVYLVIRCLFPALPEKKQWLPIPDEKDPSLEQALATPSLLLLPHILPRIHSSIFMLYALHYKKDDDEYWIRILKWNRHPDIALLSFLEVNQKFWRIDIEGKVAGSRVSTLRDSHFIDAIETLQQIKTKFTAFEKLTVIVDTFRRVNAAGMEAVGKDFCWSMDELFPVFQYVVVRARILQLGAEIHLIEDLMEPELLTGEFGIMFTTLQAAYYQILKESLAM